ncbi:MAG: hypothetical protein DRG20_06220, partial [Deltaproteobacteria bacterium]
MANRKTREKGHIFFFKACAKGKGRINKKGFTLLELILSLSILSVLVVLMAGVMSLGSRAWDRGEEMSNDSQKIRISLGLIAKQLKSIYPFSLRKGTISYVAFNGKENLLDFVSTYSFTTKGIEAMFRVTYQVKNDKKNEKENLLVQEEWMLDGKKFKEGKGNEGIAWSLIKNAESIRFSFYDLDEEKWLKEWKAEEKKSLPALIKVTITKMKPG